MKSMKKYEFLYETLYEKVWKSMKFCTGLLRPYMKKYENVDENYFFVMNLYEKVWNSMKNYEFDFI